MSVVVTPVCDVALAHELRVAVLRLARRIRSARVDTSLTLSQLSALAVVDVRGPLTAGDLAALERVQPPTMTKMLAALAEREFVVREPHPTDRRASLIAITPHGHAVMEAERRSRDQWMAGELASVTAADRVLIAKLLPLLDRLGECEEPI